MNDDIDRLAADLEKYNRAYRSGQPLISDREYDELVEKLRRLDPRHPFLQRVEPEVFESRREIRHPVPMLSTEKAYTRDQLQRFVDRVEKEARRIGIEEVLFRVTPKLDGLAARDDGDVFVTRGNGEVGYEISSAFDKGVVPLGGRGKGLGEIVIRKSYFEEHLASEFEHPRNMVVGIIASDVLNEHARQALQDGAVHFVPYSELPSWTGRGREMVENMAAITEELMAEVDYPTDGMVAEVTDERLRARMGATAHHYRWQIAIKTRGETAVTTVEDIQWQVGRTGNVTPVLRVAPVSLSGATIRRVTAHHAGMVQRIRPGRGARIEIIRSGEVIPKIERVITPSDDFTIPEQCPSCGGQLNWQNDFLKCRNPACRAQAVQRIRYWFQTLGTADWFGIKTVQKLVAAGYDTLEKIYAMDQEDFERLGFGPVQSRNLAEALALSRSKPVEDWRFLAAFGIPDLGKGESRRLLNYFPLEKLPEVKAGDIEKIHGFGEITSHSITAGLAAVADTFRHMLALGFNLQRTPLAESQPEVRSPVAGKGIVFTGKMKGGSREEMQEEARRLGARVQSAVSGRTDYLVCGEKVGRAKLDKARRLGVTIMTEAQYRRMIGEGARRAGTEEPSGGEP